MKRMILVDGTLFRSEYLESRTYQVITKFNSIEKLEEHLKMNLSETLVFSDKVDNNLNFDENDKFNLYHKGNEYILYILCLEMDKSMWTDVFFCNGWSMGQ